MDNKINDYIRKNINDFKARRMLKSGIRRYNENVHIKFVDRFNEENFPLVMPYPAMMPRNAEDGNVYLCFEKNEIEYVMVVDDFCCNHSISAYKKDNSSRVRIGALFYLIEPKNGNIAVRDYVVHKNYARRGIGGNILRALILTEVDLLSFANIYVHASATKIVSEHLSQDELESHYEKYCLVLCSDCYSGAYIGHPPKNYVRRNLLKQIEKLITKY